MRASSVLPDENPDDNHEGVAVRWAIGDPFQDRVGGYVHTYRLAEIRPYTSPRTGHQTATLHWLGSCVVCGAAFMCVSGRRPKDLVRTCLDHRGQWLPQRGRA
jgi:hypothetical protein